VKSDRSAVVLHHFGLGRTIRFQAAVSDTSGGKHPESSHQLIVRPRCLRAAYSNTDKTSMPMYGAWCRVSGACRSTLWGGKSEYQLCGNTTSARWQVTLCDLIWHVRSRSAEASCRLLYSVSLYLLSHALYEKYDDSCSSPDSMTHTHTRTGEAGAGQRWKAAV